MVREPDATRQPTPHDDQLMSKHRVLSLKPQLRLEWRGQDGQSETEQPDHSASLGDSITLSTRIRFSVHTAKAASAGLERGLDRERLDGYITAARRLIWKTPWRSWKTSEKSAVISEASMGNGVTVAQQTLTLFV